MPCPAETKKDRAHGRNYPALLMFSSKTGRRCYHKAPLSGFEWRMFREIKSISRYQVLCKNTIYDAYQTDVRTTRQSVPCKYPIGSFSSKEFEVIGGLSGHVAKEHLYPEYSETSVVPLNHTVLLLTLITLQTRVRVRIFRWLGRAVMHHESRNSSLPSFLSARQKWQKFKSW